MKRLLAIGTFFVLVSCSNTEESIVEDQGCFSNGTKNYKWTMVTTWPKNFPGLGMGPENFSKYVNEMTCGRMQIKVYGAGEFVPALGVFDAVSQGNVQLGHGASYYWTGKVKSSQFFTAVPFGLTAQEMNGWLHYGGGMELWEEAYEPFNLIPLAGGNSGVQMAGWFKKEINSLSDLEGLKMRIPGLAGEVFTRAGAETVTLPGNEIFLSLQQGVVDAAEWVGPYNDLTFGFHQVADYYYYPGWHEPGTCLEAFINLKSWNELNNDLKRLVEICCMKSNSAIASEFFARNSFAMKKLNDEFKVNFVKYPQQLLKTLNERSSEVVFDYANKDNLGKKILTSILEYRKLFMFWSDYSEKSFLESRTDL